MVPQGARLSDLPTLGSLDGAEMAGLIAFRRGWIDQLYVLPSAQRRGVGSELLQIAQQAYARLRTNQMCCTVGRDWRGQHRLRRSRSSCCCAPMFVCCPRGHRLIVPPPARFIVVHRPTMRWQNALGGKGVGALHDEPRNPATKARALPW